MNNKGGNNSSAKSAKGLKASMIAQGISIILNFAKAFLFTFFIAPENFGLIALSASITGIIQLLKDFGYSTYIVQRNNISDHELAFINSRVLFFGVIAFLLIGIVSIPVSAFYQHKELYWIMPITGIQFVLNSFTVVPIALLRKQMEFDKVAKIEVSSGVFSLIGGLLLLMFTKSYWVLLFTSTSYFVFQVLFSFIYSPCRYKLVNPFNKQVNKESSRFGTHLTIINVLTFISYNIDNLIIGKITGSATLGVYSKSYEFGMTNFEKLRRPIQHVYFTDLAAKDQSERYRLFFQYLFLIVSILVIIVGPVLIYMDFFTAKFLNIEWTGLNSMLPPFLLSSFIWITMSMADQLLIITPDLKRYLALGVSKAVMGCLAILVSSFWGAEAIAWSFFIYHVILFVPFCYQVFIGSGATSLKAKKLLKDTSLIVVSAFFAVFSPWILKENGIVTEPFAFILFIINAVILYMQVWPYFEEYNTFRSFYRLLFFRKVPGL